MEPISSLLCSQELAPGPEPDESTPHLPTVFYLKVYSNNTFPSMPWSSDQYPPFGFLNYVILLNVTTLNILRKKYEL